MSIEVMKMALEALEQLQGGCTDSDDGTVEAITVWCPEVIDALRQAIAEAEQAQPVAWINKSRNLLSWDKFYADMTPLYTAPVDAVNMKQERVDETAERKHMTDLASVGEVGVWGEREWVGLTEPELHEINPTWPAPGQHWDYEDVLAFAHAIEAKLKEKNT